VPRVIRVLLHVESRGTPHHVYLRGAQALRPDLHHGVPFQNAPPATPPKRRAAKRPAARVGKPRRSGR
jgi:Chorismate mutase type I